MAHEDISTIECSLNSDLAAVRDWLKTNKLSCNTSKTSYMTIGCRQNLTKAKCMNLRMDERPFEYKPTKLLGGFILMKCLPGMITRSNIFRIKSRMACECCI